MPFRHENTHRSGNRGTGESADATIVRMRVETEDSASGPVDPEQPASERIRPPLDARPKRGLGSWPVIIVGLALTLGGFVLTSRTAPCSDFHAGTQFSGSDDRLAEWIGGCGHDLGEARATLLADGVLIAGYAIAAGGILRRWWPLYQAPRLKRRERLMVALPFITAALDVAENIATWSALGSRWASRYTYPDNLFVPTLVSTLAWLKMLAYGAGLLSVAAVCLLAFARRNESARPIPRPDQPIVMRELPPPTDLGVCCSGGGIRAAAFALGALDQLERAGIMARARWLAAVSGGNYASTAWTLARVDDRSGHAAADVIEWLNSPIPYSKSPKHRFLRNGPGGLGRSVITALLYIALQRRRARRPRGRRGLADRAADREQGDPAEVPRLRGLPAVPSTCRASSGSRRCRCSFSPGSCCSSRRCRRGGPHGCGDRRSMLGGDRRGGRPAHCRVPVADGLRRQLGAPRRPQLPCCHHRSGVAVRRRWPSCGAWPASRCSAGSPTSCRTSAACSSPSPASSGPARSPPTRPRASDCCRRRRDGSPSSFGFIAVYLFVGITHPSIHRIYRKRLRRSFGVRRDAEGRLYSPHQRDQITWDQLPAERSGARRVLRPPARRHRARRAAGRHVHDLASRGVHRRLRHLHREVPGAECPMTSPASAPSRRGWRRRAPPSPRRWGASRGARRTP